MRFQGAIFDIDGVLVDSLHSRAWREALRELIDTERAGIRDRTSYCPERSTQDVYQQVIAGQSRLAGARAALEYFRVPDAGCRAERYAPVKQEHITKLIKLGQFTAFPDVLRFVLNVTTVGIPVAATSSGKNADLLLRQVRLDTFAGEHHPDSPLIRPRLTLLGLLATDVSGRDLPRGRPHPLIFVTAASEIGAVPGN
jgi:beta-phosphoglucomutase-like phosphatase (HAD superfamily)